VTAAVFTLLGGRLILTGPRPPEDALWLAASLTPLPGARVLDAGAGIGTVGLALLTRCPGVALTAVELQPSLARRATANGALNGHPSYLCHPGNLLDLTPAEPFDAVLANPPFHPQDQGHSSPNPARHTAHSQPPGLLASWLARLAAITTPAAPIHLLIHANNHDALAAAAQNLGLGALLTPLATHPARPPKRLLARLNKQQPAAWRVTAPLPLYSPALREAVLAQGQPLDLPA
jgi:tRNA1(Val) A37 N6-methylase TrmN6